MIWHLILGGIAGFLAGKVMHGEGYGIIVLFSLPFFPISPVKYLRQYGK